MKETNAFEAANKNCYSKIGKKYSEADVLAVWDCVSKCIEEKLLKGQGVCIKDLGLFTLSQWTINVGGNKFEQVTRPIFCLASKLEQFYNLKTRHMFTSGKIRADRLSFMCIASSLGCSREMAEDCITEVLQAFVRLLSENGNVEFPFVRIGKLQIRNKEVHMTFYKDFLTRIDEASNKYVTGEQPPPSSTEQSVLSGRATPLAQYRPSDGFHTVMPVNRSKKCGISRPTSQPGDAKPPLARLSDGEKQVSNLDCGQDLLVTAVNKMRLRGGGDISQIKKSAGAVENENEEMDLMSMPMCPCSPRLNKSSEDCKYSQESRRSVRGSMSQNVSKCSKSVEEVRSAVSCTRSRKSKMTQSSSAKRCSSATDEGSNAANDVPPNSEEVIKEPKHLDSELCVRCQLQSMRAISYKPASPSATLQKHAKDRMVELHILNQDADDLKKKWEKEEACRKRTVEHAMYNKQVGDKIREEKTKKVVESPRAYLFLKRPDTPPRLDVAISKEYKAITEAKRESLKKEKAESKELERCKQIHVANHLENVQWATLCERERNKLKYRHDLDTQIKCKEDFRKMYPEDEAVATDTRGVPLFDPGPTEYNKEAADVHKYHVFQAELKHQKMRQEEEQRLADEQKWLRELHEEANKERCARALKQMQDMSDITKSWKDAYMNKVQREQEEKAYRGNPGYLLEPLVPRCMRCKNKLGFPSESIVAPRF